MTIRDTVLIIEDDRSIENFISTVLTANNYDVLTARTGKEACLMISSRCPDVVLLDLGLPDMDGMSVIKSVREWSCIPIIVVSARSHERDKVEALDCGADDYLTKPFGTSELLARIRAAIRHTRAGGTNPDVVNSGIYSVGGLVIDYDKHAVSVDGNEVHMTQNEFKILTLLATFAGRILTYDFIIERIWGPCAKGDNQILRVNMANIRRKIEKKPAEPRYILTEIGVGYRLCEEE